MGENDDIRALVIRLERRQDQFEERFGARLDRMSEKLEKIAEGQAEQRQQSAALDRAFEEIGKIQAAIKPLQENQPFVQIVTDSLKAILRKLMFGAYVIGAAILFSQVWPYLPFVHPPTVPVEIKPMAPSTK